MLIGRLRVSLFAVACFAAVALLLPAVAGAGGFTFNDLGTLGGTVTGAFSINDSGSITGSSRLSNGAEHAFIWTRANGMQDLGTLGGRNSRPGNINSAGMIVGYSDTQLTFISPSHAFLWNGTTMQDIGPPGYDYSVGQRINDNGLILGQYQLADGTYRSATYQNGTWTDIPIGADAVNNLNVFAGRTCNPFPNCHAAIWDGTTTTDLGTLHGGDYSEAYDLNDAGVAVGYSTVANPPTEGTNSSAFIWNGTMSDLTPYPANYPSSAAAINRFGDVVGNATFSAGRGAALWTSGLQIDLNQYAPTGWHLATASDINGNGEIVGSATNPAGETRGYLLTPRPTVEDGQTYGGFHAANPTHFWAEPVNSATGAFTTKATDLALPGVGVPFVFSRSYTSADTTEGRLGPGWTDSFSASLAVQQNGDVLLHGEDGQQVLYSIQDDGTFKALGALSTLTAVTGGYELVTHKQIHYIFDAAGTLQSMKDRNAQGVSLSYDGGGKLTSVSDSVGRQVTFTYNGSLISNVALPDGRDVSFGYTNGYLTSVTDARGNNSSYLYDGGARLWKIIDQNQHTVVQNTYGSDGRVTEQIDADGNHSIFGWDASTQTATFTDARNKTWSDVYNDNVLQKSIDPIGNTVSYSYDSNLNVTAKTDARSNTISMTYDTRGNMRTRTAPAPLSYQEVWTYNARNDPLTYKDGRGQVTDYGYDSAGNLTSITRPDPDGPGPLGRPQTFYGRDSAGTGLLTSITDPRGKQTLFSYTNGSLTETRSPLGNRTTMGYDGSGRMTTLVEPRGNVAGGSQGDYTWTYSYDDANQLETQTDPLGNVTTLFYDLAGNLSWRRDANLHVTSYGYDDANLLTSVTAPDPDGPGGPLAAPVTRFTYDPTGNLKIREDGNQHQTVYTYDDANRPITITSPGSRQWTNSYDANGNLTKLVDANGNATPTVGDGQTTYGYDALNRLTSLTYSDTTPNVTFVYDGNGNRTQTTDGSGTETYAYDYLNRLTTVTRGSTVFSYGYDLANLTQATYPGSTAVTYGYDNDERLQSVTSGGVSTTYTYDPAGNLFTTTLPTGTGYVETRAYDRAGRLTEVKSEKAGTPLARFVITPDNIGNPTQIVRTGSLTQTQTYTYDAMDRLKSVCFQAGTCAGASDPFIRWTYDGVRNRLTEARPTATTSYTYNAADEMTQAGSTNYTYDQNGNERSAGSRTFTYDLANRLKTTTLATTTTTYSYDGDGKRLQASTGTQAAKKTNFLWDIKQNVPQLALERDGNNSPLRTYRYGLRRISQTAGNSTSYFIYDGLGSVTNLASSTGSTQWTWSYEPFGGIRTELKASGSQPDNLSKFTGEYLDPTGLYYFRARQYDPATGRFLAPDPLQPATESPQVGAYAYVNDRPTVLTDPTGLCWSALCWASHAGEATLNFVDKHRTVIAGGVILGCGLFTGGTCFAIGAAGAMVDVGLDGRDVANGTMSGREFAVRAGINIGTIGLAEKIPNLAAAAGRSDLAVHISFGRLYNPRFNALYTGGAEGLDELLKLAATTK
jgi:RHS repeat-associated protein